MKRLIVLLCFSFALIILSNSLVSAAVCSSPEQTILRLSAATNAQGGVASGSSNYPISICFNSLFPSATSPGASPWTCKADKSNLILRLSATTNAHGQIPTASPAYSNEICYGDLSCRVRASCNPDEVLVVSLSSVTNAHLSSTSSYPQRICCKVGTTLPGQTTPELRWEKYNENRNVAEEIANAKLGQTVELVYDLPGITNGTSLTFNILEADSLLSGGADDNVKTISNVIASNGKAIALWHITQADLDKSESGDYSEFYFKVNSYASSYLSINPNPSNHPPKAIITSPINGGIYFLGSNIVFSQASTDEEGPVTVSWNLGDSSTSTSKSSFNHIYLNDSQKTITLTAKDTEGLTDTSSVSILIIGEGNYIFAYISNPEDNGQVPDTTVYYNGTSSYAISISKDPLTINCLGGSCPLMTSGCQPGSLPSCQLNVADPQNKRKIYSDLNFSWKFFEDKDSASTGQVSDLGKFDGLRTYASQGPNKKISLTVFGFGVSSSSSNIFEILRGSGCNVEGTYWYDDEITYPTSQDGICGGPDRITGGGNDCCPRYQWCSEDTSSTDPNNQHEGIFCANCQTTYSQEINNEQQELSIELCSDYNKVSTDPAERKRQCQADCNNVWQHSVEVQFGSSVDPKIKISEGCAWIRNAANQEVCGLNYTIKTIEPIDGIDPLPLSCFTETTRDECNQETNERVIEWLSYNPSNPSDTNSVCYDSGTFTGLCSKPSIKLPFFTPINLFISLLSISIVYLIYYSIRKNEK